MSENERELRKVAEVDECKVLITFDNNFQLIPAARNYDVKMEDDWEGGRVVGSIQS